MQPPWGLTGVACAQMILWPATCAYGDLNLAPTITEPTPPLASLCADVRATITHEIAHYTRQEWGHPSLNSVLTQVNIPGAVGGSPISDLVSRHFWNADTDLTHGSWQSAPTYIGADLYTPSSGAAFNAGTTLFTGGSSFTAALAPGSGGAMYARAFALPGQQVTVQQGDVLGSTWPTSVQIWTDGTRRRMCLARRSANGRQFALWTDNPQVPVANSTDSNRFAGTRRVLCAESSNGGTVWNLCSPATGIPGVATRAGIACSYDPARDQVVLAFSNNEERLMTAQVSGTSSGQLGWSSPQTLLDSLGQNIWAPDGPSVYFDPFASNDFGLITWFDGSALDSRRMWIRFASSTLRYIYDSAAVNLVGSDALRSPVVALVVAGSAHWAEVRQFSSAQLRTRWRSVGGTVLFSEDSSVQEGATPRVHDWYTGAGSNSMLVEQAILREGYQF
jgi:hypothetical protein